MFSIIQVVRRCSCSQRRLISLSRVRRTYVQQVHKSKAVKAKPVKSKLKELVHGEYSDLNPTKVTSILEAKERKKRARFAQETTDFGYLMRPYMEKYFSDIKNVLHETPSFLQEHFVVVSFLGLENVKQLENSYTVDKHVESLLAENKLPYAVHICRMAKDKGSVGMNRILQHLLKKGDHNLATKVFNNMKKWGCTPTERTPVILSKHTIKSEKSLSSTEVQKLIQNYDHSMNKSKTAVSKLILSNSMLETLARSSYVSYAIALFKDIPETGRFSRDSKTYTTMLNMIAHQPTPISREILSLRKSIWSEVQQREHAGELEVDAKLVDAYCNSLAIQKDPKYYHMLLDIKKQYFSDDINVESSIRKFPFTSREFDILFKCAVNTGLHEEAACLFESVSDFKQMKLDLANYHNILRNAYKLSESQAYTEKVFETMLTDYRAGNQSAHPNSLTIHLVWRNYLQSKGKDIDLQGIENTIQKILPELDISVDEMILSTYVGLYYKVFNSSFGRRPGGRAGIQAVKFIKEHLDEISEVSSRQKFPTRVKKALLNASNICDYTLNHTDNRSKIDDELLWIKDVKSNIQQLLKTLADNFNPKPEITEEAMPVKRFNKRPEGREKRQSRNVISLKDRDQDYA